MIFVSSLPVWESTSLPTWESKVKEIIIKVYFGLLFLRNVSKTIFDNTDFEEFWCSLKIERAGVWVLVLSVFIRIQKWKQRFFVLFRTKNSFRKQELDNPYISLYTNR